MTNQEGGFSNLTIVCGICGRPGGPEDFNKTKSGRGYDNACRECRWLQRGLAIMGNDLVMIQTGYGDGLLPDETSWLFIQNFAFRLLAKHKLTKEIVVAWANQPL